MGNGQKLARCSGKTGGVSLAFDSEKLLMRVVE